MESTVIVLAAGSSRRMGQPKPLLEFDGRTCLSLVLSACARSRATETVLVVGGDAAAVRAGVVTAALLHGEGFREPKVVENQSWEKGQTSSFKAGLEESSGRADAFLLMPVDLPLITTADLDALIDRFSQHPRGRSLFIAANEGRRGHPILFSSIHRARLLELGDGEPLNGYVRMHEGESDLVEVGHDGILASMNTVEEYRGVLARYRAR